MPEKAELEEIIRNNPQVDAQQLSENGRLAEELQAYGAMGRGYGLVSPFARKRVQVVDSPLEDPRTTHLRRV